MEDEGAAARMGAAVEDEIAVLRPSLVRFAWSLAYDADEADDLAQEAIDTRYSLASRHASSGPNLE